MSELPKGWIETELENICIITMGQSPPSSTYNINRIGLPFFQGKADFGTLYPSARIYCSEPKKVAEKKDVLLSVRAPVGPTNICIERSCIGRGLASIKYLLDDNSKFILYFFRNIESELSIAGTGSTFTAISKSQIYNLKLPLPPLNEQKRIVEKLDKLLTRVEEAKARLEKIPVIIKRFRQSVLKAAVTGELTKDWRERKGKIESAKELLERIRVERIKRYGAECKKAKIEIKRKPQKKFLDIIPKVDYGITTDIPNSWVITNIDFLAWVTKLAGFEYTKYVKFSKKGEVPVVRAQNVQMGRFVEENLLYIDKKTSDFLERSQLFGREILMVFIGAGTGNVCLCPSDKRWHLAPNVAKIDVDGISNQYLNYYLQSQIGLQNTLSFMKATAQPSLSMETIRRIAVQLPPLEEQREIVKRVETLFKTADEIEDRYKKAKAYVDKLTQSILAKAFRGELVPQDPNDEPAGELLAKIKLEKEKLSLDKKQKKNRRGK